MAEASQWALLQDTRLPVVHQSEGGGQMARNRVVQFLGTGSDGRGDLLHVSDCTVAGCQKYTTRPSCVPEDKGRARVGTLFEWLAVDVVPLT